MNAHLLFLACKSSLSEADSACLLYCAVRGAEARLLFAAKSGVFLSVVSAEMVQIVRWHKYT